MIFEVFRVKELPDYKWYDPSVDHHGAFLYRKTFEELILWYRQFLPGEGSASIAAVPQLCYVTFNPNCCELGRFYEEDFIKKSDLYILEKLFEFELNIRQWVIRDNDGYITNEGKNAKELRAYLEYS